MQRLIILRVGSTFEWLHWGLPVYQWQGWWLIQQRYGMAGTIEGRAVPGITKSGLQHQEANGITIILRLLCKRVHREYLKSARQHYAIAAIFMAYKMNKGHKPFALMRSCNALSLKMDLRPYATTRLFNMRRTRCRLWLKPLLSRRKRPRVEIIIREGRRDIPRSE